MEHYSLQFSIYNECNESLVSSEEQRATFDHWPNSKTRVGETSWVLSVYFNMPELELLGQINTTNTGM